MKKQQRKICFVCKAKKYVKYLEKEEINRGQSHIFWRCKNLQMCKIRRMGANYKK